MRAQTVIGAPALAPRGARIRRCVRPYTPERDLRIQSSDLAIDNTGASIVLTLPQD
jgi:hypothetical protein